MKGKCFGGPYDGLMWQDTKLVRTVYETDSPPYHVTKTEKPEARVAGRYVWMDGKWRWQAGPVQTRQATA
jgi:hypothetical protein